ncbi:MAG: hypothetical protein JO356_16265 [Acidobacteria bacterium]|nr:hypothetical protein [Acidobacteriota bacterium]
MAEYAMAMPRLGLQLVAGVSPAPVTSEIPLFIYSTRASRDGQTYEGSIVGGSPFSAATNNTTTRVNFVIVPVVLNFNFSGGNTITFSPTARDSGCLGGTNTALGLTQRSPLFHPASFTMNGIKVGDTGAVLRQDFFIDAQAWC